MWAPLGGEHEGNLQGLRRPLTLPTRGFLPLLSVRVVSTAPPPSNYSSSSFRRSSFCEDPGAVGVRAAARGPEAMVGSGCCRCAVGFHQVQVGMPGPSPLGPAGCLTSQPPRSRVYTLLSLCMKMREGGWCRASAKPPGHSASRPVVRPEVPARLRPSLHGGAGVPATGVTAVPAPQVLLHRPHPSVDSEINSNCSLRKFRP